MDTPPLLLLLLLLLSSALWTNDYPICSSSLATLSRLLLLLSLGHDILLRGVNVVIASRNARSLGVSQPRVLVRALAARLHVPCVRNVADLVRQSTLVRDVARLRGGGLHSLAIPRLHAGQLVQRLGLGHPRQHLRHSHKVHVGTRREIERELNNEIPTR